jgi:isocitrate/isopropylmalate dehydrogenase
MMIIIFLHFASGDLMTYSICRIPGDGIGYDVMEAAMIVMHRIPLDIEWIDADAGWSSWQKSYTTVPEETWKALETTQCCLFGAITSKPGIKNFFSAILHIRQHLDLYINMRPFKAFKGVSTNYSNDIDCIIFYENSEGIYSGVEFYPVPKEFFDMHKRMERFREKDVSISCRIFTREACNNICEAAFKYAKENRRKRVTAVHKANVMRETDGMFLEEFRRVSKKYPDIETTVENVDAVAMWFIKKPSFYDVLVTTNLFGDILSDEAAQLVGGLGFAASANIGKNYALFEPSHGSAPKYAGKYKVNPIAMILSAALMLDWLGESGWAEKIRSAVKKVLLEGKIKTYDIGGQNSTLEMAEEIAKNLKV